jgi:hypothetical protein
MFRTTWFRVWTNQSKKNVLMWDETERLLDALLKEIGIGAEDIAVTMPYKAAIIHSNSAIRDGRREFSAGRGVK